MTYEKESRYFSYPDDNANDPYARMEADAKRRIQFIKSNIPFWCNRKNETITPKACALRHEDEEDHEYCAMCCSFGREANRIFPPKPPESQFLSSLREIAEEEKGKSQEQDHKMSDIPVAERETRPISLEAFNFRPHNPGEVSCGWRPSSPSVTLAANVLYINSASIKKFHLEHRQLVSLHFDPEKRAFLLDFSDDQPPHLQLRVTHRKGGDAKVSLRGFRRKFHFDLEGKYKVALFDTEQNKMLILLDEEKINGDV
mgnify:FL=1